MTDEIVYAKPALWDASRAARARHLGLVVRLSIRCALRGHERRSQRPTRCVEVSACQQCGRYIGARVVDDSSCRWCRPTMKRG